MTAALQALLEGVIDYAGLFPPARLELNEALGNFSNYRRNGQAWMLRHFILPASRLAQLAEDVELIGDGLPWTLSLLTGGGQTAVEWTAALEKDLWRIAEFAKRPPATMEVAALEVALPTACDPDTDSLGQLIETVLVQLAAAEIRPVALFFETTSAYALGLPMH